MQKQENLAENEFKIPNWAGKPPAGTHLDVFKGDKLLQKLMIDEKRCYFFGRNPQVCDIAVEHASCSRVHAALVYHKHLTRFFLIDLGSAHGTYISNVRLESQKAEQVPTEQTFHFGASTRRYVLREKPNQPYYRGGNTETADDNAAGEKKSAAHHFLGLPEKEEELENLTEYNTALNRRIVSMSVSEETFHAFSRRVRLNSVHFKDDEEVINPEDIDPNIGKFRNLVQTAVIATKRQKLETDHYNLAALNTGHHMIHHTTMLSAPHSSTTTSHTSPGGNVGSMLGAKLGHSMLNIAPDIELYPPAALPLAMTSSSALAVKSRLDIATVDRLSTDQLDEDQPKKKKYAKEAWPGKKPGHNLLM